jgi:hypothetical protein
MRHLGAGGTGCAAARSARNEIHSFGIPLL